MNTNKHLTQLIELLRTTRSAIAAATRPSQPRIDSLLNPPYLHH